MSKRKIIERQPMDLSSVVDYDLLQISNEEIKDVFTKWIPGDIIRIGPFYFMYVLRDDVTPEMWDTLKEYVLEFLNISCRWSIEPSYLEKVFGLSNFLIICFSDEYNKYYTQPIFGFFLASYKGTTSHLYLNCFSEYQIKLTGGTFLRCLGLTILKKLGVKTFYNDAANSNLALVFTRHGFKFGKKSCEEEDEITKLHDVMTPQEVLKSLPEDYETSWGYRMKLCNVDETQMCFQAFENMRKMLPLIQNDPTLIEFP
jgi:hypothetical protein